MNRAREMQVVGCVIDPRKSWLLPKWDMMMLAALLFTVIVTPVEVTPPVHMRGREATARPLPPALAPRPLCGRAPRALGKSLGSEACRGRP